MVLPGRALLFDSPHRNHRRWLDCDWPKLTIDPPDGPVRRGHSHGDSMQDEFENPRANTNAPPESEVQEEESDGLTLDDAAERSIDSRAGDELEDIEFDG